MFPHPTAARLILPLICCAILVPAAPAQAERGSRSSKDRLEVRQVDSRLSASGNSIFVTGSVAVPAAGRISVRVRTGGRVLCRSTRKLRARGRFRFKCVIRRSALSRFESRSAPTGRTVATTLRITFENYGEYGEAWLKSLVPLPPLPPFPPLPG